MDYRNLRHTDLRVSRASLGTMTFGSSTDEATAQRMVERCLDAGVNFFDTANVYNQGAAESALGRALGPKRHQVIVATKVFGKMGDGPDDGGLSRAAVRKAIDQSLQRLGRDYVDIYYLHQPDYNTPIEETVTVLQELVGAGKIRYPAVSNYAAWQVAEIHALAQKNAFKPPHISQVMYNLLARHIEDEYLSFASRYGIAVIPYNPLAGGLLTGKQRPDAGPIPGSRFDKNPMYLERYWHEETFAAVGELGAVALRAGKTLVELALQWLLSQPQVASIILGASTMEQLEENLKACEGKPLDKETLGECDQVWKRLRGVTPKYNR
jgi:aryl-alcohol dehydrogenase-like predicted oxidoreductase